MLLGVRGKRIPTRYLDAQQSTMNNSKQKPIGIITIKKAMKIKSTTLRGKIRFLSIINGKYHTKIKGKFK